MDRHLADRWMRQAERLAGIPHQEGGLWHAYRRKAATELKSAYQHADPETMLVPSRRDGSCGRCDEPAN